MSNCYNCYNGYMVNNNNMFLFLDIYEDSSRNIRIDQISLTAPHCRVSVQSSVTYTEVLCVQEVVTQFI